MEMTMLKSKIIHETDKPSLDKLHVFMETVVKGQGNICIDIFGNDEWAQEVAAVLLRALKRAVKEKTDEPE